MAVDPSLASTPPMGFNTWNRFGMQIDERLIEETMDALCVLGLAELGYRYVNIDDGWMAGERDRRGRLRPDPVRFAQGIASLAERAHSLGLRLGIYSDCGVRTCGGLPASYGHERDDAAQFADWGVDYLKHDWCNVPFDAFPGLTHREVAQILYGRMSDAIVATGHPMVFSLCSWGDGEPWEWARGVGHLWRTTGDIVDAYRRPAATGWSGDLVSIFRRNVTLAPYAGPGGWNDPDMLEVGNGGMTDTEYRSHFALWCLMAAPLMIGTDLRDVKASTLAILTNRDLIAIDQDPLGRPCEVVEQKDDVWVLRRPLANGDMAVAVFNEGDTPAEATLDYARLLPPASAWHAQDVWTGQERTVRGRDDVPLAPHATEVWRIRPEPSDAPAPAAATDPLSS